MFCPKAASAYVNAKIIIKLISNVGKAFSFALPCLRCNGGFMYMTAQTILDYVGGEGGRGGDQQRS